MDCVQKLNVHIPNIYIWILTRIYGYGFSTDDYLYILAQKLAIFT